MFTNKDAAIALAEKDFNFFAALVLQDDYKFDFPDLYCSTYQEILNAAIQPRRFDQFAIGLPRGFAKTTFAKLAIAHLFCFTKRRFAGLAAANNDLAVNVLADIWGYLRSPNLVALFGDPTANIEVDTKTQKVFYFRDRWVALATVGARGSPRGWNIKNQRPDILLMDDVQTREDSASDIETERLLTWIFATFMRTRSPEGCTTIFLGNMYPGKNSILQRLHDNPAWRSIVLGAILADGTSLWEELHPIKFLLQDYEQSRRDNLLDIFMAEVMNDNTANPAVSFSESDFANPNLVDNEAPTSNFIIIDPSGKKKYSDKTAIALFNLYGETPKLEKLDLGVYTPKETIERAIQLALEARCYTIAVESVAYQESLLFWFEEYLEISGIDGILLIPITPKNRSKNIRIRDMLNELKAGTLLVDKKIKPIVLEQIRNWRPHRNNNVDDVLDVLAYANQFVRDHGDDLPVILDAAMPLQKPKLAPLSKVCSF